MLTAGIVCEYNPFHRGHAYLIDRLRAQGATHVAVVMSGNFVQRGDAAALTKRARARQALLCGADLVAELPLPWAVAGAERFALGGIALLDALGADVVGFGSECGSVDRLRAASDALSSPLLRDAMRGELQKGSTFAAARQSAVERLFGGETAGLLRDPNNILGIEYLRAIERLGSRMAPVTVRRVGSAHDAEGGVFCSSRQLRSLLKSGGDCSSLMPAPAYAVLREELSAGRAPADLFLAERAVLAKLRCMAEADFAALPDLSEGLENRILGAVRRATGLEELYSLAKTKRYPLARIRRIALSAFLGLKASDAAGTPPYLRILGIGERGPEILRAARDAAKLPVVSRASGLSALDGRARGIAALESRSADLYALCLPKAAPCGLDWAEKLVTPDEF